jgi:fructokinase
LEAARGLLEHGVHVVLFTDGAAGVHIVTREDDMVVAVPTVDVVDTVGAGDAFGGGFLAFWLARGLTRADLNSPENLKWAVGRAVTVAAMTCQRVGANPPYLHELPAEA